MTTQTAEFRHEALIYSDQANFLASAVPFVREGVEAGEPVLVAATPATIDLLRRHLGRHAESVLFTDMTGVGANPSRIIPAWRQFVSEHGGGSRPLRGVGEPVWKGRTQAELAECARHEALLNEAFADSPPLWLLCPYDAASLGLSTLEAVRRTHPLLRQPDGCQESDAFDRVGEAAAPMDEPLPDPPGESHELSFHDQEPGRVRRHVSREAARCGLDAGRTADLLLAVGEVVDNSVRHGGGRGVVRTWVEAGTLVCEICDRGRLSGPMLGRVRPGPGGGGGWGLWLVNQLCDLVQLRSFPTGSVVRLHKRVDHRAGQAWQLGSDLRTAKARPAGVAVSEPVEALPIAMHEVRRPLSLTLNYLSLLREELTGVTPRQQQLLQQAEVRVSNLRRQLDQLVLLSKMLAGTGESGPLMSCDVAQELEQVVDQALGEAEVAGGRVTVRWPQAPVRALVDASVLRQVVSNLLSNAVKYSQEAPDVHVEIDCGERPYLTVADHGIGMDEQTASSIFTKGFRGDSVRDREGSGLGLYLSRRAVELIQGRLELESTEPGRGSTFRLELQPEESGTRESAAEPFRPEEA